MKEELQGKLVEILTSIQEAAGKAGEFAMEQLPDVAQSYLLYGRVALTLYVVVSLAVVIIGLGAIHRIESKNKDHPDFPNGLLYGVGGALTLMIPGGIFVANISQFLLVWFAPKVRLLKEIATLIK